MTAFSTPNKARHTLALRTPFSVHRFLTLDKPETYAGTACCSLTGWIATHGCVSRAHFVDGSFVRVRGTVRLVDYSRNIAAMAAFPKLLKAFKQIQMINIKNAVDGGELTPEEATAQRRELNKMEAEVKSAPVQELVLLGETLYSEGVIRVKVHPSGAPDGYVFAGNGDVEWLTEGLAAGGISQSPPGAEWVAVGQVSAASPVSTLPPIPTGNGMEDAVEALGSHFRDLIATGSGAVFPALEFAPLAVYREIAGP